MSDVSREDSRYSSRREEFKLSSPTFELTKWLHSRERSAGVSIRDGPSRVQLCISDNRQLSHKNWWKLSIPTSASDLSFKELGTMKIHQFSTYISIKNNQSVFAVDAEKYLYSAKTKLVNYTTINLIDMSASAELSDIAARNA
jgi:hypothetical protein